MFLTLLEPTVCETPTRSKNDRKKTQAYFPALYWQTCRQRPVIIPLLTACYWVNLDTAKSSQLLSSIVTQGNTHIQEGQQTETEDYCYHLSVDLHFSLMCDQRSFSVLIVSAPKQLHNHSNTTRNKQQWSSNDQGYCNMNPWTGKRILSCN